MCKFLTKKGTFCSRPPVKNGYGYCTYHAKPGVKRPRRQYILSKPKAEPIVLTSVSDLASPILPDTKDDFFEKYTIDKILSSKEKDSSSNTLILFGHHNASGTTIAAKLFLEYNTKDTALKEEHAKFMYESLMYQTIGQQGLTNIVRWISTQRYDVLSFGLLASAKLKKAVRTIRAPKKKVKNITLIINELRVNSKILDFDTLPVTNMDKKNILFQIIFTLAQMEALGCQHNDLRLGNILIDESPEEKAIMYNGRTLPIRYKVLLFDWDLGVCSACGANPILDLDYCPDYGMCNTLNPRFDVYTVLRAFEIPGDEGYAAFRKAAGINKVVKVYDYNGPEESYQKIIPKIPKGEYITQAWPDRMCNYDSIKKICSPFPVGEPGRLKTPGELIHHPYFNNLFL